MLIRSLPDTADMFCTSICPNLTHTAFHIGANFKFQQRAFQKFFFLLFQVKNLVPQ